MLDELKLLAGLIGLELIKTSASRYTLSNKHGLVVTTESDMAGVLWYLRTRIAKKLPTDEAV